MLAAHQNREEELHWDQNESLRPEKYAQAVHVLIDFAFHEDAFILPHRDDGEWWGERDGD